MEPHMIKPAPVSGPDPGDPERGRQDWLAIFIVILIVAICTAAAFAVITQTPFEERCEREAAKLGADGVIAFQECWGKFGDGRRPIKF